MMMMMMMMMMVLTGSRLRQQESWRRVGHVPAASAVGRTDIGSCANKAPLAVAYCHGQSPAVVV